MKVWKWAVAGYLIVPAVLSAAAALGVSHAAVPELGLGAALAAAWFSVMATVILVQAVNPLAAITLQILCVFWMCVAATIAFLTGNAGVGWYTSLCATGFLAPALLYPLWRRYWWPYYLLRI